MKRIAFIGLLVFVVVGCTIDQLKKAEEVNAKVGTTAKAAEDVGIPYAGYAVLASTLVGWGLGKYAEIRKWKPMLTQVVTGMQNGLATYKSPEVTATMTAAQDAALDERTKQEVAKIVATLPETPKV